MVNSQEICDFVNQCHDPNEAAHAVTEQVTAELLLDKSRSGEERTKPGAGPGAARRGRHYLELSLKSCVLAFSITVKFTLDPIVLTIKKIFLAGLPSS